jgi:DMSO reductase anchor subunit
VVDKADAVAAATKGEFLPSAARPQVTAPTTVYTSSSPLPEGLVAGDIRTVKPWHSHGPLVVMLVLTQLAVGSFAFMQLVPGVIGAELAGAAMANQALFSIALTLLALGASTAHLGRPQYAFRAILGIGTSWLSREVATFGALAGLGVLYTALLQLPRLPSVAAYVPGAVTALLPFVGGALAVTGLVAVFTSVMLYAVTKRTWWHGSRTGLKFYGTASVLGAASTVFALTTTVTLGGALEGSALSLVRTLLVAIPVIISIKLAVEAKVLRHRHDVTVTDITRTALLIDGALKPIWRARVAAGLVGGVLLPCVLLATAGSLERGAAVLAAVILAALAAGELCERAMFFRAMSSIRMPGGVR